jgi:hypothetical protein
MINNTSKSASLAARIWILAMVSASEHKATRKGIKPGEAEVEIPVGSTVSYTSSGPRFHVDSLSPTYQLLSEHVWGLGHWTEPHDAGITTKRHGNWTVSATAGHAYEESTVTIVDHSKSAHRAVHMHCPARSDWVGAAQNVDTVEKAVKVFTRYDHLIKEGKGRATALKVALDAT